MRRRYDRNPLARDVDAELATALQDVREALGQKRRPLGA